MQILIILGKFSYAELLPEVRSARQIYLSNYSDNCHGLLAKNNNKTMGDLARLSWHLLTNAGILESVSKILVPHQMSLEMNHYELPLKVVGSEYILLPPFSSTALSGDLAY